MDGAAHAAQHKPWNPQAATAKRLTARCVSSKKHSSALSWHLPLLLDHHISTTKLCKVLLAHVGVHLAMLHCGCTLPIPAGLYLKKVLGYPADTASQLVSDVTQLCFSDSIVWKAWHRSVQGNTLPHE